MAPRSLIPFLVAAGALAAPAAAAADGIHHTVLDIRGADGTRAQIRETWSADDAVRTAVRQGGRLVAETLATSSGTLTWNPRTGKVTRGAAMPMRHVEPEADLAARLARGDLVEAGVATVRAGTGRVLQRVTSKATWRYVVSPDDMRLLQASVIDADGTVRVVTDVLVDETLPDTPQHRAALALQSRADASAARSRSRTLAGGMRAR